MEYLILNHAETWSLNWLNFNIVHGERGGFQLDKSAPINNDKRFRGILRTIRINLIHEQIGSVCSKVLYHSFSIS